jgi:hypothetical protein
MCHRRRWASAAKRTLLDARDFFPPRSRGAGASRLAVYRGTGFAEMRIATRYDKLARNFLAGILTAATITWWLN